MTHLPHRQVFLLLLGSILFLGFGCRQTEESLSPTEGPTSNTRASLATTDNCPEGTDRYVREGTALTGLSFCHERRTDSGVLVSISTIGNTTIVSAGANQDAIIPFAAPSDDITAFLKEHLLTTEQRDACTIVADSLGAGVQSYRIQAVTNETSARCGDIMNGTFYQRANQSGWLFYLTTGPQAVLPSNTWIETLEAAGHEDTEVSAADATWFNDTLRVPHTDHEFGVAFSYPERWGPILRNTYTDETGTCISKRTLTFLGVNAMKPGLAAVATGVACTPQETETGFGEEVRQLTGNENGQDPCLKQGATICSNLPINVSPFWLWHFDKIQRGTTVLENVDTYGGYHNGHPLSGLYLSNELFVTAGLDPLSDAWKQLVESLTFLPLAP